MDAIYENAFFTTAAHGQLTTPPHPLESQTLHSVSGMETQIEVRITPIHDFLSPVGVVLGGIGEEAPSIILGRGWCYQERILSTQILHITPFEVLHEDAKRRIKCQCGDGHASLMPHVRRPNIKDAKKPYFLWMEIVQQYSQRWFTKQWDLFSGLARVARRFHDYHHPGRYFAGLWTVSLLRWLCWKSKRQPLSGSINSGCNTCGSWPRRIRERPPSARYVVPSFSWASRFGPCVFLTYAWKGNLL
jgi:hypothetical protein